MSNLQQKLEADRAMRDAARRLLETDLEAVRGDSVHPSLAKRTAIGVRETSLTVADQAIDYVRSHPLAVAGSILAFLIILFRNPLLGLLSDDEAPHTEPVTSPGSSPAHKSRAEPGEPQDRSGRR